jgi:hypothetical protein
VARQELRTLDSGLDEKLVERFTQRVIAQVELPSAREPDVRAASEFWVDDASTLGVTCTITGSTYELPHPWDGSMESAIALADEAADGTASLVMTTPHYAWLRSGKA